MSVLRFPLAVVFALGLASCGTSHAETPDPNLTCFIATPMGPQEVPGVTTDAFGTVQLAYNADTKTFDIVAVIQGIALADFTGWHVHAAPIAVNGPVIVNLTVIASFVDIGGGMLRAEGTGIEFPPAYEADLLAGTCYVNIHTTAEPAGEIRGQLIALP